MKPKDLSFHEMIALQDAGSEAGSYLESIGKFNLAELNEEEWCTFLKTILNSYGAKMRERLLNHAAPF